MLANATVPRANLAQGETTFFMRFSWDGKFVNMKNYGETYAYNYGVYLFDHARDYATSKGWDFHLDADSYSAGNPYLLRSQWYPYQEKNCWVSYNKTAGADWIDFALTLRNTDSGTEVVYYICPAGSSSITKYSNVLTGSGTIPGPASNKNGTLFGPGSTTVAESGGKLAAPKNFRGTVAAVKLWNRALSAEEIDLVFRDAASPLVLDNETLTLTTDRKVSTLTMNGDCTINGPGKLIVTAPDGITVNTGTATLACPVLFDAGSSAVSVTVDSTSKLVQTGAWSGSSPITLVGAGSDYATHSFELRGANVFTGRLTFDRAKVYLYGGASLGTTDGDTRWTVSKGANGSLVFFMGGTFAEDIVISGANNYKGWWQSARFYENSTNIFTGALNFAAAAYFTAHPGSRTFFEGTFSGYSDFCPSLEDDSEITFTTNSVYTGATFYPGGSGLVHLHSKRLGGSGTTKEYQVQAGTTWRLYGTNLINGTAGRGGLVSGTLDLNGFDQFAGACRGGAATGVVTSEAPAVWTVDQTNWADIDMGTSFRGKAVLRKQGANNLTLSGASTTEGALVVASGALTFALSGSWASSVEVAAGATLAYAGDRTLTTGTRIVLADGAFLSLAGQLIAEQGQISHAGQPLTPGKYTSSSGFVTGDGMLVVNAAIGDPLVIENDTTIDEDVVVPSVTFKGPYTVSGAGSLTVLGGDVVIDDGTENKRGYVIDVPLTLSGNVTGNGYLTLLKGASLLEATQVTNVNLCVCGTLNIAKGLQFVQLPAADNRAELILSNAVVEAGSTTIRLATGDTYYALRALAGTTNAVTCGRLTGDASNGRFRFDAGSRTDFNCPLDTLSYFCPSGTGEVSYNGKVNVWSISMNDGHAHLNAAGNVFAYGSSETPPYATRLFIAGNALLDLDVEEALSDRRAQVYVNGTLALAATQKVGPLVGSGTITSPVGATWDFEQRTYVGEVPHIEGPTSNTVVFADSVNVKKSGPHAVYFGGISTSTGELQVAAGELGFHGDGRWLSCSAVRVGEGGTLILERNRIDRHATPLYLASGAKVRLPAGNVRCGALYLNGVRQNPGSYSQANCGAYIEGDGMLWVAREPGTAVILR